MNELLDRFVARIRENDPTFFDRFARLAGSGDRVAIDGALQEGGRALVAAASAEDPRGAGQPSTDGVAVNVDSVVNLHYALNVDALLADLLARRVRTQSI